MMIEEGVVRHMAELARIELTPDERRLYQDQLKTVLGYMERLKSIDVTGVEPLAHVGDITGGMREDKIREPLSPAKAMQNAPQQDENRFVVPKVVE